MGRGDTKCRALCCQRQESAGGGEELNLHGAVKKYDMKIAAK